MGRGAGGGKGGDQGEHAARHTYRTQSRARVSQALTHVRQARRWATLGGPRQLAVIPKVGAGWGSASRPDLCRGCRVTGIPTAIDRHTRHHPRLSTPALPSVHCLVTYAMMESRISIEAEHLAGRRRGGLCRGGGSGDHAAASAGPGDLSHAQAAVSPGRRGLEALKDELLYAHQVARDEDGP